MGMEQATVAAKVKPGGRSGRRHYRRAIAARVVLAVLFGVGFFLSVAPWGRAAARAALLLPALISVSEPAPLGVVGDGVRFSRTTVPSLNGPVYLDIYEPDTAPPPIPGRRAAIIDIVGAGDHRSEPQLVNLSRSMARTGMVVVNMGTPALFGLQISAQDVEAVVTTYQTLAHWRGVDPRRIGILGFSAGGPLAALAAADPRLQDKLAFITLFGSYYDTISLLHAIGQRAVTADGHTQPWHPLYFPMLVLVISIGDTLTGSESQLLQQAFAPNGQPLAPGELAQLSPGALAVYHLLEGDEPDRVDQNLAAITPQMRALLNQLSPSRVLAKIHAPIYLLHDRSDQYVPFTQSREFAAALARAHRAYDFAEFGIFEHVEVRSNQGLSQVVGDGAQLYRILDKMLVVGS
ncbi:MAG: hypothetical protein M3Y81_15510 [Chloroflexota bacterium]|nr:hypothetical protein [Chloroflexota bacterium]